MSYRYCKQWRSFTLITNNTSSNLIFFTIHVNGMENAFPTLPISISFTWRCRVQFVIVKLIDDNNHQYCQIFGQQQCFIIKRFPCAKCNFLNTRICILAWVNTFKVCIYASRSEKVDRAMRNIAKYRFSETECRCTNRYRRSYLLRTQKHLKNRWTWGESGTEIC